MTWLHPPGRMVQSQLVHFASATFSASVMPKYAPCSTCWIGIMTMFPSGRPADRWRVQPDTDGNPMYARLPLNPLGNTVRYPIS